MALLWMDRKRRYFISSRRVKSLIEVIERTRWRREGDVTTKVQFQIPLPKVAEKYYKTRGQIDRHNKNRQDSWNLEKKLYVKEMSICLNIILLFLCIADVWLVNKHPMGPSSTINQALLYERLSEKLIINSFDLLRARSANISEILDERANALVSGAGFHLALTSRKKKCDRTTT